MSYKGGLDDEAPECSICGEHTEWDDNQDCWVCHTCCQIEV